MEHLSQSNLPDGVALSALASLGTGVGAVPVLAVRDLSERWRALLLSIGGGIMVSAAAFSLLLPAFSLSGSGLPVVVVLAVGALLIYGLEQGLPADEGSRLGLFVAAIALHHFPEGLAVGLGAEAGHSLDVAIGVGLQNLPEGLMVALALRQLGYGAALALALATVSGWLEPLGGLVGSLLSPTAAPLGMALAAGAMLYVVAHELLPSLNLRQVNNAAGLATGLVVMGVVQQIVG